MSIFFIVILIAILVIAAAIWMVVQMKNKKINEAEIKSKADKIEKESQKVEEEIIHEISIPELIGNLYSEYITNFPLWIKNERFYLNSLITEAVDLGKERDGEDTRSKTKISLNDKDYIFSFHEYKFKMPNGTLQERGELELFLNDDKILGISMAKDSTKWKTVYVEMFIEGTWIEDFQGLERKIEQEQTNGSDQSKDIIKQSDSLPKKQKLDLDYD